MAVGAVALVAVTPGPTVSAATAGPVQISRTADRILAEASDYSDVVEAQLDNGQFVFTADHGVSPGTGCEQITDVHVACDPAPKVVFHGNGGDDTFLAGNLPAKTTQVGGPGKDDLNGAGAADTLLGSGGADELLGRGGGDDLRGGSGDDELEGKEGPDTLNGGADTDACFGGTGADTVVNCE